MKDPTLSRLKRPLRPLIALLLANPEMSNAQVARLGRCDARRVSRYRRAIDAHAYPKDELLGCDEATLQALLKQPQPKRVEARPNFEALAVELPNASALVQWQHYRGGALADGQRALSYSGFNRARHAHRKLARIVASHGPSKVSRRIGRENKATPTCWNARWSTMRLVGDVDTCIRAPTPSVVLRDRAGPFDIVGASPA